MTAQPKAFAGSLPGRGGNITRAAARGRAGVSPKTAAGDLWSGFASRGDRTPLAERVANPGGSVTATGPQLILALGLLGLGTLVLCGGVAAAASRRRRAPARSGADPEA